MNSVLDRNLNELKPLNVSLGITSSYYGSCMISIGNTVVKCFVNLPKPSNKKGLNDIGLLNIEIRSNEDHLQKSIDNLKTILLDTFEKNLILKDYQRLTIDAYIIILENDGFMLPTATIGLCLAFIDAGIHIYDIISSSSIYTFIHEGELKTVLYLNDAEQEYYSAHDRGFTTLHMSYSLNHGTIAHLQYTGSHFDALTDMMAMGQNACSMVSDQLVGILRNYNKWKSQQSNVMLQTNYIPANP